MKATKLLSTLLAIKTIQLYGFNEDFSFFFYYIYIQASFLLLSSFFFFLHFSLQQARNHNLSKKTKTKEDYGKYLLASFHSIPIMSLTSLTIFLLKDWLYAWETIERRNIRKIVACVQGWAVQCTYLSCLFLVLLSFLLRKVYWRN